MFEQCSTISQLTECRVKELRSGKDPIEVNKAFAARKAEILSSQHTEFKQLSLMKLEVPVPKQYVGINFVTWEDDDPYSLIIYGV